jgi:transposase
MIALASASVSPNVSGTRLSRSMAMSSVRLTAVPIPSSRASVMVNRIMPAKSLHPWVRRHLQAVASQDEAARAVDAGAAWSGCQRELDEMPLPDGPAYVGVDGGFVRDRAGSWFEVVAGKSVPGFRRDAPEDEEQRPAKCFAFVQAHDDRPRRRLLDVLASQGYAPNQKLVLMSDGGESVRRLVTQIGPEAEHVLDCWGGRPRGIACQNWGCQSPTLEPSMSEIKRIGLDTSKAVFTLHCVDETGRQVLRTNLRRAQMVPFFRKLAPTEIALEACGSSHHWSRELAALGHEVRLIPPQYVKPFVKRAKNDRNDAEAICEAAARPGMRFVPVKSITQQAQGLVLKVRETFIDQRTRLVNALRGHAAEFGVIAAKGISQITALLEMIEAEASIPPEAKEMLALLGEEIQHLESKLNEIEAKLTAAHKANGVSQRLATIPGIGPIIGLTLAAEVDPLAFQSGRHLAAWIGLTPKEHSTGGKQLMGGISRAGNERLRRLLVTGATAVIRFAARSGNKHVSEWLVKLLQRKPRKLVAVALANKMARIAWALMKSGQTYRRLRVVAAAATP